jgi:tetratricopeptide (TPR) repeat protein
MRRLFAGWFNDLGRRADDSGLSGLAARLYSLASRLDPKWSVPWYNLGLMSKYLGRWTESLSYNEQAAALAGDDEATWWNLGISATALRDWKTARRAWQEVGIELPESQGELAWTPVPACVRIDRQNSAEVVWGERIDPARIVVLNIPLPKSRHRFRDIVLHDGVANGNRMLDGVEIPVFDELELWQRSRFGTYQASIDVLSETEESMLKSMCNEQGIGIEDWSTVRYICAECSRGNPGPHECKATNAPQKIYAFASESREGLQSVLEEWIAKTDGAGYSGLNGVVYPSI